MKYDINNPSKYPKTKFFHYSQNNSGGSFVIDNERGICESVIIEAIDYKDANNRAESIGLYFDGSGDCECCGNRWDAIYSDDKGYDFPSIWGKPLDEEYGSYYRPRVFVHYLDGSFKSVNLKEKQ